jgi:uncharacterized protein (TIGR03067 family)
VTDAHRDRRPVVILLGGGPTLHDLRLNEGLALLQGTWRCVAVNAGGQKAVGNGHTWTFNDCQLTVVTTPYIVTVDASQRPAWITLSGPQTWIGVYVIRGDELEVRLHPIGESRPKGFDGPVRGSQSLATYKRVR